MAEHSNRQLINYPKPSPALQEQIDQYLRDEDQFDKIQNPDETDVTKINDKQIALVKALLPRKWNRRILPDYVVIAVDENDPLDPDGGQWMIDGITPNYPRKVELIGDPLFVRYQRMRLQEAFPSTIFNQMVTEILRTYAS